MRQSADRRSQPPASSTYDTRFRGVGGSACSRGTWGEVSRRPSSGCCCCPDRCSLALSGCTDGLSSARRTPRRRPAPVSRARSAAPTGSRTSRRRRSSTPASLPRRRRRRWRSRGPSRTGRPRQRRPVAGQGRRLEGHVRRAGGPLRRHRGGRQVLHQGSRHFWRKTSGTRAVADLLGGRWLQSPGPKGGQAATLFNANFAKMFRELGVGVKVYKGREAYVDRHRAIGLVDRVDRSTLWVSLDGEPYPLSGRASRQAQDPGSRSRSATGTPW